MKPPLRRQRGGAGDDVSSSAAVPCSAPGLPSRLPAVAGGAGGRRSSAPTSRRAVPSPSPSIARTEPSASISGSSASSGRGSPASTSGEPGRGRRSAGGATKPGSTPLSGRCECVAATVPENPAWKPHTSELARFAWAPEAARRPVAPAPNTVRCAAVSVPDSTSRPGPDSSTLCMRTRPAETRPPSTDDERSADPSRSRTRPTTSRSVASPRTASAFPTVARRVMADTDDRSSPRSARPRARSRGGRPRSPAPARPARPSRRTPPTGGRRGSCRAPVRPEPPTSAAATLGCSTQPASTTSTQNVAAWASPARANARNTSSATRLTADEG